MKLEIGKQYILAGNRVLTHTAIVDVQHYLTGELLPNAEFVDPAKPDIKVQIELSKVKDRVLELSDFDLSRKHYSFPSIGQPSQFFRELRERQSYVGKDENGKAIYDPTKESEPVRITGTVKTDGSNCSVVLTADGDLYCQSREHLINRVTDVYGFNQFFERNRFFFKERLSRYLSDNHAVVLYGEWVGRNNSKKSAMKNVDNVFIVFAIRVIEKDEKLEGIDPNTNRKFLPYRNQHIFHQPNRSIYAVNQFKIWTWIVRPDELHKVNDYLVSVTREVEERCPVADAFGVQGIGEGVVWTAWCGDKLIHMKVKGDKHSNTKVKVLKENDESVKKVHQFIEYAVTENRMEQGLEKVNLAGYETTPANLPHFLTWVITDVLKEESDQLEKMGLKEKDFTKAAPAVIRRWWLTKCK